MNVESLKTELQQVLDSDVALRKEFNELKRSLSDYRNQLIMRDEDCKRLQVTIDVLNTKLVVMERDNTNYKAELTSFKELRSTIKEQLQAKQDEIDERLAEIQSLRSDLSALAADYEQKILDNSHLAQAELDRARAEHQNQISELKIGSNLLENKLRNDYEARINGLTEDWKNKEQQIVLQYENTISELKAGHETLLLSERESYQNQINNLSQGNQGEIDRLIATHQITLSQITGEHASRLNELEGSYKNEITNLRTALEEQRSTLTLNFGQQIDAIKQESERKESQMVSGYETRIAELENQVSASREEIANTYLQQIAQLKHEHELALTQTQNNHEARLNAVVTEYEEKLSYTLIHSNAQNSKLNEELSRAQFTAENTLEQIRELSLNIEAKSNEISGLELKIGSIEQQLQNELNKYNSLNAEYETFKVNASLSASEQVQALNNQMSGLNQAHSEYVTELSGRIEGLTLELSNLGLLFEKNTNELAGAEIRLDEKQRELESALGEIESLKNAVGKHESELETLRSEITGQAKLAIDAKELEFQKLLTENGNLIAEIDQVLGKTENLEAENNLLKTELDELKNHLAGKAEDFRETLANKNFEVTNLEANNAALCEEIKFLRNELDTTKARLGENETVAEQLGTMQDIINSLGAEKTKLLSEIEEFSLNIETMNQTIAGLNSKVAGYEAEMEGLRSGASKSAEQDAFIDRLFKQIDGLNDERLNLLSEKEKMAEQLLKMNEVVNTISQQVDSQDINVTGLNNHRKNIILATQSGEVSEKSQMKEQINDLVREIDKCIALLSA